MSNNGQSAKRASFSGKIGYVLAVAGSAVGLGNIWRFPYLAAKYGGGIFLLVYLILTVSFGYVLIMSETALGRMTRKSPVGAFQTFGKTKSFKIGGWLNAIIPIRSTDCSGRGARGGSFRIIVRSVAGLSSTLQSI